jgi:hypothetical protein
MGKSSHPIELRIIQPIEQIYFFKRYYDPWNISGHNMIVA